MKQILFALAATAVSFAAQATAPTESQNLQVIDQRTAAVASYEIVDGNSAKARLRIHWIYERSPAGPDHTIYLAYSGTENDPSMTLTETDIVQAPGPMPAVGYDPELLTAEVPLTMLFYTQSLANVQSGSIKKVIFEGAQIKSDGMNVEDLGMKSFCVQKHAKSFAIVSCPTK